MLSRDAVVKKIQDFKVKHGVLEEQDENVVATLHLMNAQGLHLAAAQDRTSRGGNDHGIDAWHFDEDTRTLLILQSKLTSSKAIALKGLEGLLDAARWLGDLLATSEMGYPPTNTGIYNLANFLAQSRESIKSVDLILISLFDSNELLDCSEYEIASNDLSKLPIYGLLKSRGGRLRLAAEQYDLKGGGIAPSPTYQLNTFEGGAMSLNTKAQLHVLYLSLRSLVDLYRRRGNLVFEKNVRLFLNTKESKARLEHPLESTLESICDGGVDPKIFPFFHVGVTLTAISYGKNDENVIELDSPFIINGCQTINIADRYLKKLEKNKAVEKIDRFKSIPVVAKIVTRASDDQLREIANCNNRQNPIDPWQLFSNDPIHVEIESSLRDVGVFYERQRGRFDAEMVRLETLQVYRNTNGTYVSVVELGQLICLCRRQLQLSAKPSEVFVNKQRHDSIFTPDVAERPRDIIWASNAHKAAKRGLQKYLQLPTQDNDQTHKIFDKAMVKQGIHFVAMMWLYQKRQDVSVAFISALNKKAAGRLIDEVESFYRMAVKKTKDFYLAESKNLQFEVAGKKLEAFITTLCSQLGLDSEGPMPFTRQACEWEIAEPVEE